MRDVACMVPLANAAQLPSIPLAAAAALLPSLPQKALVEMCSDGAPEAMCGTVDKMTSAVQAAKLASAVHDKNLPAMMGGNLGYGRED